MKIIFEESQYRGYRKRTVNNASADATIAIAYKFNTAGEKLTKSAVLSQNKTYIPVKIENVTWSADSLLTKINMNNDMIDYIVEELNRNDVQTLNIAGNGIYTLNGKFTQAQIDDYVYHLLKCVLKSDKLKIQIKSIRSGGQTGVDESGIKAGVKLGIPVRVHAPMGWCFRDNLGKDISDEKQFKERFNFIPEYNYNIINRDRKAEVVEL